MTKQFSNYSDLITFTRASKGHALRPVSYGDELVENGTFDSTPTGWLPANSTLASVAEELVVTNSVASQYGFCYQGVPTAVGKLYLFTIDITATSSNAIIRIGDDASGNLNKKEDVNRVGPDSIRSLFVATASTTYIRLGNYVNTLNATSNFDNVSLKEVLFDQPDGTLTLFEHPDGVPRVEYDADGNRLGLLVEESRTNLVTYSEDFSNASWSKAASSIDLSVYGGATPDGQTSGFEITEPSTTSTHGLRATLPFTSGQVYTLSIFAKASTSDWCQLLFGAAAFPTLHQNFNLSTGEKGAGSGFDSSQIENFGGGWYRISITATATSTASTDIYVALTDNSDSTRLPSYAGDGTSGVYLYGAQVEVGSFPTSYMKTTGNTKDRAADVAKIPVADFGFNDNAGTVFVEASVLNDQNADDRRILEISDGTTSNFFSFYQDVSAGEKISIANQSGGSLTANFDTGFTITESSIFKAIATLKDNDVAASVNGGSITTDTSTTISSALSEVNIGYLGGGSQQINGHIKSIQYYPRRLTNAQLQDLTS